ncbi:extracellular calcium-sensing receptor-like [Pantherophis guttatus]|uniref:Extracellular calcium-sensing receptor-like n=1 Tax=Pantherophis guttatus TaxID=94885 RepID=A0ABM3YRL5_PANGU|nr:extracellular calcium-sensing receptor-like [Pantherophis guttatus]
MYLRWTWIGLNFQVEKSGEQLIENAVTLFSEKGICFDFMEETVQPTFTNYVETIMNDFRKIYVTFMKSTANVIIIYCENDYTFTIALLPYFEKLIEVPVKRKDKVWIMPAQMEFTSLSLLKMLNMDGFHGAITFEVSSKEIPVFNKFLQMITPTSVEEDHLFRMFWEQVFECSFPKDNLDEDTGTMCTGEEKFENVPKSVFDTTLTGQSYSIYNAVCAVAHALQAMLSPTFKHRTREVGRETFLTQKAWQAIRE